MDVVPSVFFASLGAFDWTGELFVSEVPRGASTCRWNMQDFLEIAIGPDRNRRYMSISGAAYLRMLSVVGFEGNHLLPSQQAVAAAHREKHPDEPVPISALLEADCEYSASTEAVLTFSVALRWTRLEGIPTGPDETEKLAALLIATFVSDDARLGFSLSVGEKEVSFEIEGTQLRITGGDKRLVRTVTSWLEAKQVLLNTALEKLYRVTSIPSRHSNVPLAKQLFQAVASFVGNNVEISRGKGEPFQKKGQLDRPTYFTTKSARPRRVSDFCKVAYCVAAAKDRSLRKPQHILAVKNLLRGSEVRGKFIHQKRISKRAGLSAARGKSFLPRWMMQYNATQRRVHEAETLRDS
jgi:hypothetical protein